MLNYKLFKENGIVLKEIKKINNVYIVSDNKNKYVVKEKSNNLDDIFNYLKSRNFKYFPNKFSIDKYNIYNYIDNKITSDDERLYGTLIKDLEKMGYLLIQDGITKSNYIIARKGDKE